MSTQVPHLTQFARRTNVEKRSARDLHKILGYTEWCNFNNVVIKRAETACEENEEAISDHFVRSYKVIIGGKSRSNKRV